MSLTTRLLNDEDRVARQPGLHGQAEIEHGYSPELIGDLDTNEAEALALMKDGPQLFWDRVRERIVRQHSDLVTLTCCPKCRGPARTPRARRAKGASTVGTDLGRSVMLRARWLTY